MHSFCCLTLVVSLASFSPNVFQSHASVLVFVLFFIDSLVAVHGNSTYTHRSKDSINALFNEFQFKRCIKNNAVGKSFSLFVFFSLFTVVEICSGIELHFMITSACVLHISATLFWAAGNWTL